MKGVPGISKDRILAGALFAFAATVYVVYLEHKVHPSSPSVLYTIQNLYHDPFLLFLCGASAFLMGFAFGDLLGRNVIRSSAILSGLFYGCLITVSTYYFCLFSLLL